MATTISKEELLKAAGAVMSASKTPAAEKMNWISQLLQFMNLPLTQDLMKRIMDRILPQSKTEAKTLPDQPKKSVITGEKVFGLVMSSLANVPDEMTVSQLREWLRQNQTNIVGSLDTAIRAGIL